METVTDPNDDDVVLASAARFLIEGGEEDAASALLSCNLRFWPSGDTWYAGDETHEALHVTLTGPRSVYEILNDASHPITQAIRNALAAVLPEQTYVKHFTVHVQHIAIDPNWRRNYFKSREASASIIKPRRERPSGSETTSTSGRRARSALPQHSTGRAFCSFRIVAAGLERQAPVRTARQISSFAMRGSGAFWRSTVSRSTFPPAQCRTMRVIASFGSMVYVSSNTSMLPNATRNLARS